MNYLLIKSLHIIFVVTWFAGLFYIVRLFIYHSEAQEKNDPKEKEILISQFKIMEKRLWYGITWPSAILTCLFGPLLATWYWPISNHPWLMVKLSLVFFLLLYHYSCHRLFIQSQKGNILFSGQKLRLWNEVATLFLFSIVFLVVFKNILNMAYGIVGLLFLSVLLMFGISFYKRKRLKQR